MAQEWTSVVAFRDARTSTFLVVVAAWLASCSDGGGSTRIGMLLAVGRPCDTTVDAGPAQGVANTAAAMCPSQICLKPVVQPGASGVVDTMGLCTAECSQDSDCAGETRDPNNPADKRCSRGFACAIPFAVGPLCCKKLCVCKDFLPPTGPSMPTACTDPDTSPGACGGGTSGQPPDGLKFSICERDFTQTMTVIGNALAKKLQNLCVDNKLVDTDEDPSSGVQADCRVSLRAPVLDPGNPNQVTYQEILPALAQCPPGATSGTVTATCWQLVRDKVACPTNGQLVTVIRTAADIAAKPQLDPGTKLGMQCRTCPDPIPGTAAAPGCAYAL